MAADQKEIVTKVVYFTVKDGSKDNAQSLLDILMDLRSKSVKDPGFHQHLIARTDNSTVVEVEVYDKGADKDHLARVPLDKLKELSDDIKVTYHSTVAR